ncbi:MAG: hypothetical protein NVSMB42_16030 [Herpetosiphon sp.]
MPWYKSISRFINAIDTEYDRRIRGASNVKAYHPEGDGHGHHASIGSDAMQKPREEGGGAGTEGALQGAGGPHFDALQQDTAQH